MMMPHMAHMPLSHPMGAVPMHHPAHARAQTLRAPAPRVEPVPSRAAVRAACAPLRPALTLEESKVARQASLARYRAKKARRLSANTIRYHLRKVNADARPRIKGRFVKKSDLAALAT